jgi:citrate synthase
MKLPVEVVELMRSIPRDAEPMDALRTAVSALAFYDEGAHDLSREGALRTATRLTAQLPVVVATFGRLREGKEPVEADPSLNIASNFLYMLKGERPTEREARIIDVCLILHADHELNASTFTARIIASTLADMHSAITGAIAALKGPLHGGANEGVIHMLMEIGDESRVEAYVQNALASKKRIMGIGHRVYKTLDPRAPHLKRLAEKLSAKVDPKWLRMSEHIAEIMKKEKNLNANVDFYSATVYYSLGIPTDLFTPIFAISRVAGWTAHVLEQLADNRLIRPLSEYIGPRDLKVVPIDQR